MVDEKKIKEVSERIVSERKRLDINQSEFAKGIGISRPAVYLYESGKRLVSTEALISMYEKYGIEPNVILGVVKD